MKKLFIHIPKNGGRTLQRSREVKKLIVPNRAVNIKPNYRKQMVEVMKQYNEHVGSVMQHSRWRDIKPEITNTHRAFAIVRNPWSKVVSRYTYNQRVCQRSKNHGYYNLTFDQFIEERHKWATIPCFWHRAIRNWYSQTEHVIDEDGNVRCDILRFEYYDNEIVKYLGLSHTPRKRNVSNGQIINNKIVDRIDYKTFYNDRQIQIIADWYKQDIEYFGFDFDTPATRNTWTT